MRPSFPNMKECRKHICFAVFLCSHARTRTHKHTHYYKYKLGGFLTICEFSVIFFQHLKRYSFSNSCYNAQILFDFKTIFTP